MKRNQADGHLCPSPAAPKRPLSHMQYPEPESMLSSLDSEHSCLIHADDSSSPTNRKYSVVAVGKRSCAHRQRITFDVEEERSKRIRVEFSDGATVSGVTFQSNSSLHCASTPDAESDAASVGRHVGACHDSVCLNSRRSRIVATCSNEGDMDTHGIQQHVSIPDAESDAASGGRHGGACHDSICLNSRRSRFVATCSNEGDADTHGIRRKGADKHVTFISSRVQENKGSMLSVARQGTRDTSVSSISSCCESRHDSHSNSRIASFSSRVRDPSQTSPSHGQNSEARAQGGLASSKHVSRISTVESPHTSSVNVATKRLESRWSSFFNVGTARSKSLPVDTLQQQPSFRNVNTVRAKGFVAETMSSRGLPVDTMSSKDAPPSYVLSSGRLCLEQEAKLGRRLPTIDDDFEEYFSSLML